VGRQAAGRQVAVVANIAAAAEGTAVAVGTVAAVADIEGPDTRVRAAEHKPPAGPAVGNRAVDAAGKRRELVGRSLVEDIQGGRNSAEGRQEPGADRRPADHNLREDNSAELAEFPAVQAELRVRDIHPVLLQRKAEESQAEVRDTEAAEGRRAAPGWAHNRAAEPLPEESDLARVVAVWTWKPLEKEQPKTQRTSLEKFTSVHSAEQPRCSLSPADQPTHESPVTAETRNRNGIFRGIGFQPVTSWTDRLEAYPTFLM